MNESSFKPPPLPPAIVKQLNPPQKEALRESKRLLKKLLEE